MSATLTYVNHTSDSAIICAICLEPVEADAVKTSCHAFLLCSDCLGYWLLSLILDDRRVKCICRAVVDSGNMKPLVFERREGGDGMEFEWDEGEDFESADEGINEEDEEEEGGGD